jgi:hypothetical protein
MERICYSQKFEEGTVVIGITSNNKRKISKIVETRKWKDKRKEDEG